MVNKIKFDFVGTNPSELKIGDKINVTSYWKDSNVSNTWDKNNSYLYNVTINEINKINDDCYILNCIRHWEHINKDSKEKIRVNNLGQTKNIYCDSQKGYCTRKVITLIN